MALTPTQLANLNQLLSNFPSSSNHPNLLAEMFELIAVSSPAMAAEWRSETLARVQGLQANADKPYTDSITAINAS